MARKANKIFDELKSSTWCDLVGCDIGSETQYARAIDTRGRELSRKVVEFNNDADGFQKAKDWPVELAAVHGKKQIVMGLEPTGHYWFCLAAWMASNGIRCMITCILRPG